MNNMEDKELQELFDAKRTVEANRRRQEGLRQMLEAKGGAQAPRKVRPLWPVWAGAAAASIALLLLTLPALFDNQESAPSMVARTEVPEASTPSAPSATSDPGTPRPRRNPRTPRIPSNPGTPSAPSTPSIPSAPTEVIDDVEVIEAIEAPAEEAIPETVAPTPRVIRRQSTLIACTEGCHAPEGTSENASRNVQINFFNNDQYADATIHTFVISK